MIRILTLLLILGLRTTLQAQSLDKMNENTRQKILLKVAKAAVWKYGPDYYREYGKPEIKHGYVSETARKYFTEEEQVKYRNRSYYTVKYFYDRTQESFPEDYCAFVFIWGDTGKAFNIFFTTLGLNIEGIEKSNKNTRDGIRKMSWQKRPPGAFDPPKPQRVEVEYIPKKKETKDTSERK